MEGLIEVNTGQQNQNQSIELKQWLNNNGLGKLAKCIADDDGISIDDLLEMDKEDLQNWVKTDLKLNTVFFSKLWNALNKKRNSKIPTNSAKIVKIIITEKEEKYSNKLTERINDLDAKENEFKSAMKSLHDSKTKEMQNISSLMNSLYKQLKQRQTELEKELTLKCAEKEKIIENQLNSLKNYGKILNDANNKYNEMLQNNEDSKTRNDYISSIVTKQINSSNPCQIPLETKPKILFTFQQELMQYIKSFGSIITYETPPAPKITVTKIDAKFMTVRLSPSIKQSAMMQNKKYELRVQTSDDVNIDEKTDENVIIKSVDVSNPVVTIDNLKMDTMYYLLSRAQNEHGWTQYTKNNMIKQKTQKMPKTIDYDGIFDKETLYSEKHFIDNYTVNMDPNASMALLSKPLKYNAEITRWQVQFVKYDSSHQSNFIGVASNRITNNCWNYGLHGSYGITTKCGTVYLDSKVTTDQSYNVQLPQNSIVLVEYHWETSTLTLTLKSNQQQLWTKQLPSNRTWYPAIGLNTGTCKLVPFS